MISTGGPSASGQAGDDWPDRLSPVSPWPQCQPAVVAAAVLQLQSFTAVLLTTLLYWKAEAPPAYVKACIGGCLPVARSEHVRTFCSTQPQESKSKFYAAIKTHCSSPELPAVWSESQKHPLKTQLTCLPSPGCGGHYCYRWEETDWEDRRKMRSDTTLVLSVSINTAIQPSSQHFILQLGGWVLTSSSSS